MYEEMYIPLPDQEAYLERIGLARDEDLPATKETLHKLILAHLTHVPFENLDVYEKNLCPDLTVQGLFDKIVTNRRGGYCFEMNGIFYTLLQAVGYTCYPVIGRVLRGRTYIPNPTHRGSLVELPEGRFYCDVGFGGSASAYPIPLNGEETPDGYHIEYEGPNCVIFEKQKDGTYQRMLMFSDKPAYPVDFIPLNFHMAMWADSYFHMKPMANLRMDFGNIAIDGNIFRVHRNGEVTEHIMETREEYFAVLREHFGIVMKN